VSLRVPTQILTGDWRCNVGPSQRNDLVEKHEGNAQFIA
jgi:hypothetical protein